MNLSKLWEMAEDRGACILQSTGSQTVRHNLATKQQQHTVSILPLMDIWIIYSFDNYKRNIKNICMCFFCVSSRDSSITEQSVIYSTRLEW